MRIFCPECAICTSVLANDHIAQFNVLHILHMAGTTPRPKRQEEPPLALATVSWSTGGAEPAAMGARPTYTLAHTEKAPAPRSQQHRQLTPVQQLTNTRNAACLPATVLPLGSESRHRLRRCQWPCNTTAACDASAISRRPAMPVE